MTRTDKTESEVRESLRRKLQERWNTYSAEILRRPSTEIYERADEIAAARFCYDQLTENLTSYPAEYPEYLLRFQDPLSVVQDQWLSGHNVDYSDEFEQALWTIQDERAAEQGNQFAQYFLDHMNDPQGPPLLASATRLLHHMSRVFQDETPPSLPVINFVDSKLRRRIREKKIAMGHKPDDHEEQEITRR